MRIITLFLCTVTIGYSQLLFTPVETKNIEDLLLDFHFTEAQELFVKKSQIDSTIYSLSDWLLLKNEIGDYRELFNWLDHSALYSDTAKINLILESAAKTEERYRAEIAGNSSHRAFQFFIASFNQKELVVALRYYRLANVFKARFFAEERYRLKESFNSVKNLYQKQLYLSALQFIDSIQINEKNNPTFSELRDSLQKTVEMINERIHERETDKRKNHPQETFNHTLGISIGVLPIYMTTFNDILWSMKTKGNSYPFWAKVDAIKPSAGYSFLFQLNYYYSPVFSQQLRFEIGSMTHSSIIMEGTTVTISLPQTLSSYSTLIKYGFSDKIGLRSFLSAGIGYITIQRSEQQIYIADFIINNYRIKEYYLLSDNLSSPKVLAETGLEYFSGSMSHLFFEGAFGMHYITAPKKLISPTYFSISLTAGIIL